MPATSKGVARAPYLLRAYAHACTCAKAVNELGTASTMDKALQRIDGYWAVYLGFFGEQSIIFHFDVVDRRDGVIVWRDGRQLRTEEDAHGIETAQPGGAGDWPF